MKVLQYAAVCRNFVVSVVLFLICSGFSAEKEVVCGPPIIIVKT